MQLDSESGSLAAEHCSPMMFYCLARIPTTAVPNHFPPLTFIHPRSLGRTASHSKLNDLLIWASDPKTPCFVIVGYPLRPGARDVRWRQASSWGFHVPVGESRGRACWGHSAPGQKVMSFTGGSRMGGPSHALFPATGSAHRGFLQLVWLSAPALVPHGQPHSLLSPWTPGSSPWCPLLLITLLWPMAIATLSWGSNAQYQGGSG